MTLTAKKLFRTVKRVLDVVFSLSFLAIFSPIIFIVAVITLLTDGRPIFFSQDRVGKNWRIYKIYKFRTMQNTALKYQIGQNLNKVSTRFGYFLRKTRIDELPQFINILIGQMSFIGPRPEIENLAKKYGRKEKEIFNYVPGLTSPATILYVDEDKILQNYKDKTKVYISKVVPDKIGIDLIFFKNETLFTDALILFRTIKLLIKKIFSS